MKKQSKGISPADYLRELTRRDPAFLEERKQLRDRVASIERPSQPTPLQIVYDEKIHYVEIDPSISWRLTLIEIWDAFVKLWPLADFDEVLGEISDLEKGRWPAPRRLMHIIRYDHGPSGTFIHTMIHETLSGDEVKKEWQRMKKAFNASRRRETFVGVPLIGVPRHTKMEGKTVFQRFRPEIAKQKLKIYDMYVKEGKTILEIVQHLKVPRSSVHRLLTSVCIDIGYNRPKGQFHFNPSFDLHTHFSGCSPCQTGILCSLAEEKLGLKPRYLRESPTADTETINEINVKREQGRKRR